MNIRIPLPLIKTFLAISAAIFAVAAPPSMKVIKAARLLDVQTGTYVSPAMVLIEGERIKAAGTQVIIPVGTKVLDLGDATLLPGLIDTHTHMLLQFPENSTADLDLDVAVFSEDTATRALRGVKLAREMVEAGFTTIRDLGNAGANGDMALREAIRNGWIVGPRMLVSTRIISPIGGQMTRLPKESQGVIDLDYRVISGVEEARKAVKQATYEGADWIKVVVAANGRSPSLSLDELKAIVDESHRANLKVAAHTDRAAAAKVAVEAGVDSIEHGWSITHGVLDLMASKKIYLVPTDVTATAFTDLGHPDKAIVEHYEKREFENGERLRYAIKIGVPIAAGSDMTQPIHGQDRGHSSMEMFRAYRNAGLSGIEIIRMTTASAAELLGWQDRVGSIHAGKYADMIAVQGNPLQDISELERVIFVMKGGQIVKEHVHP
jgi:imidazolonepropionase-like amidohydrolase